MHHFYLGCTSKEALLSSGKYDGTYTVAPIFRIWKVKMHTKEKHM